MVNASPAAQAPEVELLPGFSGQKLSQSQFTQIAGKLAGYPFVKIVLDRHEGKIHFINNNRYPFHADYVGEQILGKKPGEIDAEIDAFNQTVYFDHDRRFYFGILSLQKTPESTGPDTQFFTLETVEVDTMDRPMVEYFYGFVKDWVDPLIPVLFKPANTLQETIVKEIDPTALPRIFSHQLFAQARYIALNPGRAIGRIRAFRSEMDYKRVAHTVEWFDIVVMHRVPDDIPRVSGIINAHHTTPLSHTNVLASGWKIPNAIQIGIFDRIEKDGLHEQWVEYVVENSASEVSLKKTEKPQDVQAPAWKVNRVEIESPELLNTPIVSLDQLRAADRYKYGTKAANLGEMRYLLADGSERMLGFYRIPRPPRENLMPYLAKFLGVPESADMASASHDFLKKTVRVPKGIAIPFAVQQEFLESSSAIQQGIGKLKMALELGVREVDALCLQLQQSIRTVRMTDKLRNRIDAEIAKHLSGVSAFVVRSSSNAEDLAGFSAAGIYESISSVSKADKIFESVKEVWASLLSPRSVRLRHQVGISLDDCYMGVIIQEMIESDIGGVLVTTNPSNVKDFRNVYMNVSLKSVEKVVHGSVLPIQMIYNTVEGGGRTLSLGDFAEGISAEQGAMLQKLAFIGRLLQSHFSPDYTFSQPVDIEWLASAEGIGLLQIRPYSE
ncbi:MAG: hypothetical protein JST04_08035 [Bdellovibrionales bacterium]|nr:hypothetical protein [Bdellovibrionales bacterium]